jgi:cytochrome c oxidase subunit 2
MEQLIFFHDHSLLILIIITVLVGYLILALFFNSYINRYLLEGHLIEVVWTILPAIILIFIALPSLRLLYLLDEVGNPRLTLKAVGHQWYWSYEYSDFADLEFDSYMIPRADLPLNGFRLLDVDNRVVLPVATQVRILITAADVIHSWTIPRFGVKVDGVPGRLNQIRFIINRPGLYYGQCSEICGANHSFIPIVIESTNLDSFVSWVNSLN